MFEGVLRKVYGDKVPEELKDIKHVTVYVHEPNSPLTDKIDDNSITFGYKNTTPKGLNAVLNTIQDGFRDLILDAYIEASENNVANVHLQTEKTDELWWSLDIAKGAVKQYSDDVYESMVTVL